VSLILYSYFVVEFSSLFFSRQGTQVLFLSVDHHKDLPGVPILGNASELWPSEIRHILALKCLLVGSDYDFEGSLVRNEFHEPSSLFLYLYWKSFLDFGHQGEHHILLMVLGVHALGKVLMASGLIGGYWVGVLLHWDLSESLVVRRYNNLRLWNFNFL
jgi:hypothetical protein